MRRIPCKDRNKRSGFNPGFISWDVDFGFEFQPSVSHLHPNPSAQIGAVGSVASRSSEARGAAAEAAAAGAGGDLPGARRGGGGGEPWLVGWTQKRGMSFGFRVSPFKPKRVPSNRDTQISALKGCQGKRAGRNNQMVPFSTPGKSVVEGVW